MALLYTNLCPNPSFETNTTSWGANMSSGITGGSIAQTSEWAYDGTSALRCTGTQPNDASTRGVGARIAAATISVIAGNPYSWSCRVHTVDPSPTRGYQLQIDWYDASSVFISSNAATEVADEGADGLLLTQENITAPALAAFARPTVRLLTNTALDVMTFDFDSVIFVAGTTVPSYFDGTYPNALWTGTAHASTSELYDSLVITTGGRSHSDEEPLSVFLGGENISCYIDEGLTFGNSDPGGYETAQFTLPRIASVKRGERILITAGLETVWEGRVAEVGQQLAGSPQTQVSGEGYGALLKDNRMSEVYVDRDLGQWTEAGLERRIDLAGRVESLSVATDQAQDPALVASITGPWSSTGPPRVESWLDAGEENLWGLIDYAWVRGANLDNTDTNWTWRIDSASDDVATATDNTGNLRAAGPEAGATFTLPTAYRWLLTRLFYAAAGNATQDQIDLYWKRLAAFGDHGLTIRGTLPAARGFYASDIVRDVLSRVSGIEEGQIEDATDFTITQLAYKTPVLHQQVIDDVARFVAYHWGTWASPSVLGSRPRFDFLPLPHRANAFASRRDFDDLDLSERLETLYDTAKVSYTDAAGSTHVVTRTRATSELQEAISTGRTIDLDLGPGTETQAETYGDFVLALSERAARAAGNGTLTGDVQTDSGEKPAYLLQSGLDRLRIADLPGLPLFDEQRNEFAVKRMNVTVGREGISTNVELGTGADLPEVLQARLQAATESGVR